VDKQTPTPVRQPCRSHRPGRALLCVGDQQWKLQAPPAPIL